MIEDYKSLLNDKRISDGERRKMKQGTHFHTFDNSNFLRLVLTIAVVIWVDGDRGGLGAIPLSVKVKTCQI